MAEKLTLDGAFVVVKSFLQSIVHPNEESVSDPGSDLVLSREDEGTLVLAGTEVEEYRHCLARLWAVLAPSERVSHRAIERAFQTALYTAVDIREKRNPDISARVDAAVREVKKTLTGKTSRYRVVTPVCGLSSVDLPTTVGKHQFANFDDDQLRYFRAAIATHQVPEDELRKRHDRVEELLDPGVLGGRVVAVAEVDALEPGAAESLALREIRLTLDVLNFFGDLMPYNYARLTLPGDEERTRIVVAQLQDNGGHWGSYRRNHRRVGSMGEFSLAKLREHDAKANIGLQRAEELLTVTRSDLDKRLLAGLQWAGRATYDPRKEEAFLLYAISLESFILADASHEELSYRLRLRVARLLGDSPETRKRLLDLVRDLYKVRSEIVHNGRFIVTDVDLARMRTLAKACLVRACTSPDLMRLRTTSDLTNWFETQLLK